MNTTPLHNSASATGLSTRSAFSNKLRTIFQKIGRGFRLSLEAYGNGAMPPM